MLKKLKSVLETPKGLLLILALKATVFSVLLYLVNSQWSIVIVFLTVSFYFYFRSFFNTRQFLVSFLTLLAASLLAVNLSIVNSQWSIVIVIFFSFLFFLLLGIKDLIFIRREPLYYLLNSLLLLTVFVYFFSFNNFEQPFWFLVKSSAAFSATFFLFKEFLFMSLRGGAEAISAPLGNQKVNLMASGSAFLSLQFLWVIGFLPFRSFNAASLMLLIALILEDFIVHHLSGTINRRIVLRNITMFLILAMIIFGASKWSP
ncbi:MAG: hypothetical protein Q8N28_02815 [bacterium]|nr:hypothetical protein [bacterium]